MSISLLRSSGSTAVAEGYFAPAEVPFPLPAIAGSLTFSSDSVDDTVLGNGAREVTGTCVYEKIIDGERYHLHQNFRVGMQGLSPAIPQAEDGLPTGTIPENPNAPVPELLQGAVVRVTNMRVSAAGSGITPAGESFPRQVNAGAISAKIDGVTVNIIKPYEGTAEFPHYYSASDLDIQIVRYSASLIKVTGAPARVTIEPYCKEWKGAEVRLQTGYLLLDDEVIKTRTSAISDPVLLPPLTDFYLRCSDVAGGPKVSADMEARADIRSRQQWVAI